jgi:hypothetical protein
LVRLLVLGGKLQVEACVAQCVDNVGTALRAVLGLSVGNPTEAMEVLESVPSEMDGRKDVEALRNQALHYLLLAMGEPMTDAILQRAWGIVVSFIEERAQGKSVVQKPAWSVLEELLERDVVGDETKGELANAVARYLGPIHRLWAAGPWTETCWSQGLSEKVKVSAPPAASLKLS